MCAPVAGLAAKTCITTAAGTICATGLGVPFLIAGAGLFVIAMLASSEDKTT